jgi:hypothetical protein
MFPSDCSDNKSGLGETMLLRGTDMLLISEALSENGACGMVERGTDSSTERRRGLRIRQNRPIKIFEPTTHRFFGGQTEDLSATGLRIELPLSTPVRPGKRVHVHVGLGRHGEALAHRRKMIPAKIVWVERGDNQTTGHLTAGIEFVASIAAHLDAA